MGKRLIILLVAVIAVVSLAAAGCAPGAAPPAEEEEAAPAEEEEEEAPPAAPEAEVIKWVGQSHVPSGNPMFDSLQRVADTIRSASGGRLDMQVEAAGGVCPATEEFDGCDSGVIDFGVTCYMYWMDKFPCAGILTMRAGGMSPCEKYLWHCSEEAGALIDEMAQDYDVKLIPGCGVLCPPELFLHCDKPIDKPGDIKGLKLRAAGDGGAILAALGAGTVFMPAGEIFESMHRGVIDGFECSSPTIDWSLSLQEVGHYVYASGCRAPHEYNPFLMNMDSWSELPDDLKVIVEEVNRSEALKYYSEVTTKDMVYLQEFRDYGCDVSLLNPEVEVAFVEAANEYFDERAADDELMARVLKSMRDFESAFRSTWTRP